MDEKLINQFGNPLIEVSVDVDDDGEKERMDEWMDGRRIHSKFTPLKLPTLFFFKKTSKNVCQL